MEKKILDHLWVAIIAGGEGTRLFPYSSPDRPKQFCLMNDHDTFIQNVIENFARIGVKRNRIVIITVNETQTRLAKAQAMSRDVISQNIHQIPPGLDYGGAMAEATRFVGELDPEGILINTPSDQYVSLGDEFKVTIQNAIEAASQGLPVVVGVKVNDLATAMGCGHAIYEESDEVCPRVLKFIEKPDEKEATRIMRAGNSACSTGISVWSVEAFLNYVHYDCPSKLATNELMEELPNLRIAVGSFEWHDCGTLKSFYEVSKKTPHHRNASLGGGKIDRFGCLDGFFLCDEGYRLHAAGCRNVAVVVTTIESKPTVAVIDIKESNHVKKLAEDFARNKDLLIHDFSTRAHNNFVMFSNVSEETITCFACVDGYTINAYRADDGMIDVYVSGKRAT